MKKGKIYCLDYHTKHYCIEFNCNNEICYSNWKYGTKRCISCGCKLTRNFKGRLNPFYKGIIKHEGYIYILDSSHPRATWQARYVKKADLVIENHIGRYLTKNEIVHHRNHIRNDDKLDNLRLFKNNNEHKKFEKREEQRNAKHISSSL